MRLATELIDAISSADDLEVALGAWEAEQQRAGEGLKRLSDVMETKLITRVPDFAGMTQDDLSIWWSEVQVVLEEVMG